MRQTEQPPTPPRPPEETAPPPGSSLYYALRFAPPEARPWLEQLHRLGREVREIPDAVSEPGVARLKLQWWEEEIERLFAGAPRHPRTRALLPAVEQWSLPREEFLGLVTATRDELGRDGYPDFPRQLENALQGAGSLARLLARTLGCREPAPLEAAGRLGAVDHLGRRLRDAMPCARAGRLPLPAETLRAAGANAEDLVHGRPTPDLRLALGDQAGRIGSLYAETLKALDPDSRSALTHLRVLAALRLALVRTLAQDEFRDLGHRVSLTPLRKLWIAWRSAR
ncbi:MAG: squalene/phytoene synthase family protein [Gammaproteobacteria bacterium]|nr:squalene/phytoene synthase family protein [Gammaproteobacteria bacterium]